MKISYLIPMISESHSMACSKIAIISSGWWEWQLSRLSNCTMTFQSSPACFSTSMSIKNNVNNHNRLFCSCLARLRVKYKFAKVSYLHILFSLFCGIPSHVCMFDVNPFLCTIQCKILLHRVFFDFLYLYVLFYGISHVSIATILSNNYA